MALSEKSILKNIKNGNLEDSGYVRPRMSYAQLIAEALNNAPEKSLVLSDIYKAINAKYPYYELETRGWQNSLRHTLTLNKSFIKVQKDRTDLKRGWIWKLAEGNSIPAIDYICSDCNRGFASHTTLKNHTIATGHEGKLQKSEDLDGVFSDKSFLEDHSIPARRIGTVDTSIYIEIPSKMKKEDHSIRPLKDSNPWLVENVKAFSFLNCPECAFKVKEENLFQDHAMKHHSLSSVLFGSSSKTECVYIKSEPNEDIMEDPLIKTESTETEDIIEPEMTESEPIEDIIEHQMIENEPNEGSTGKFFTYVTKTRANLTTYSRRLENYNGTNIFEIDIMKKSSPIDEFL